MKTPQHKGEIMKALADFHYFLKDSYPQMELSSLLLSFEKNYVQESPISLRSICRTFIFNSIYQKTTTLKGQKKMIYFWPFQFHHCDFMIPVIKVLENHETSYKVLVFRENLVPYCASHGVEADLIPLQKKARNIWSIIRYQLSFLELIIKLIVQRKSIRWKKAALNSFKNIGAIEHSKQAAQAIALTRSSQYHMIGFDLSLHGQALLEEFSDLNIRTGRIQNGASNYLLSQYSKVAEIFFWDELSMKPYLESNWKGTPHIVGNLKLARKFKAGPKKSWQKRIKKNLLASDRVIFVAFSGAGHKTTLKNHLRSLDYLELLVDRLKTTLFIIKLHPKDKLHYYQKFEKYGNTLLTFQLPLTEQPDALDALMTANLLITGASTVALDALTLGKKVISIDPMGELAQFGFLQDEKIYLWQDESQLDEVIEVIKNSPSRNLRKFLYDIDPSLRIATIITQKPTL